MAPARDESLRTLGNLSLLSSKFNTSIRYAPWATKKAGVRNRHGLERYARGLETLADDLERADWDEIAIRERGERLAEQVLGVWPFPTA